MRQCEWESVLSRQNVKAAAQLGDAWASYGHQGRLVRYGPIRLGIIGPRSNQGVPSVLVRDNTLTL